MEWRLVNFGGACFLCASFRSICRTVEKMTHPAVGLTTGVTIRQPASVRSWIIQVQIRLHSHHQGILRWRTCLNTQIIYTKESMTRPTEPLCFVVEERRLMRCCGTERLEEVQPENLMSLQGRKVQSTKVEYFVDKSIVSVICKCFECQ